VITEAKSEVNLRFWALFAALTFASGFKLSKLVGRESKEGSDAELLSFLDCWKVGLMSYRMHQRCA